jgi:phosphatidate cytidylyltransferase
MLKRGYRVKDSSQLLGAHGGMLDRVDALLFVGPVVYYYATLVVRTGPG